MPTFKIKIREATHKDRFAVQKLNQETLPVVYEVDQWIHLIGQKGKHTQKDSIVTYVMTKSNEIIGFCACDGTGCVVTFAIAEKERNNKYGTQLLTYAMDEMVKRGHDEITLRVKVSNASAIHVYEKLGFKQVELLEKYYKAGYDGDVDEDAYRMVWKKA